MTYSFKISEFPYQTYGKALVAEISAATSRANSVWSITNSASAKSSPTSNKDRQELAERAKQTISELIAHKPPGVFDRHPLNMPVALWLHEDGEDIPANPTIAVIAFPDYFWFNGPSSAPTDVAYQAIFIAIDPKWHDGRPWSGHVFSTSFDKIYRETTIAEFGAIPGLRERIDSALAQFHPSQETMPRKADRRLERRAFAKIRLNLPKYDKV